jgi:hypothetical protein
LEQRNWKRERRISKLENVFVVWATTELTQHLGNDNEQEEQYVLVFKQHIQIFLSNTRMLNDRPKQSTTKDKQAIAGIRCIMCHGELELQRRGEEIEQVLVKSFQYEVDITVTIRKQIRNIQA